MTELVPSYLRYRRESEYEVTTMNAKANTAYHELIAKTERENPGDVWAGFEHERDAFETGYEAGHEASRPVVDREELLQVVAEHIDDLDSVTPMGTPGEHLERRAVHVTDAVLALLSGR